MQASVPVSLLVTQWILLAALGLLVVIAFRQLAYYRGLSAASVGGLELGSLAPTFEYRAVFKGAAASELTELVPGSRDLALLFGDPSCGACDRALSALEQFSKSPIGAQWDVFVATSAPAADLSRSEPFKMSGLTVGVVDPVVVHTLYQVQQLPLLYAVDTAGRVQAKGVVTNGTAVEKILSMPGENPEHARRVRRRLSPKELSTHGTRG